MIRIDKKVFSGRVVCANLGIERHQAVRSIYMVEAHEISTMKGGQLRKM